MPKTVSLPSGLRGFRERDQHLIQRGNALGAEHLRPVRRADDDSRGRPDLELLSERLFADDIVLDQVHRLHEAFGLLEDEAGRRAGSAEGGGIEVDVHVGVNINATTAIP